MYLKAKWNYLLTKFVMRCWGILLLQSEVFLKLSRYGIIEQLTTYKNLMKIKRWGFSVILIGVHTYTCELLVVSKPEINFKFWNHNEIVWLARDKLWFLAKTFSWNWVLGPNSGLHSLKTLVSIIFAYCISHYFRVQLFSRFWTRCGNSRVVNFAIFLMLSLL